MSKNPPLPEPKYAIMWDDPENLDAPTNIVTPTKEWLGMALHGGILPPVEVYWVLHNDGDVVSEIGRFLLHKAPPVGSMTEEEAMEYLIKKDVPERVWKDYRGNRQILKVVSVDKIPKDRLQRDAWTINQEAA